MPDREKVINSIKACAHHPSHDCQSCDYCGVRSGDKEDKFEKTGLTPILAEGLKYAPQIKEAPVSLFCKLKDIIELGSHDMFLAEITGVSVDEKLIDEKGKICLEKAKLVTYSHGEYYTIGKLLGFFGYSVASKEALKRRMPSKKTKKSNTNGNK